jgi:hypothetical protein
VNSRYRCGKQWVMYGLKMTRVPAARWYGPMSQGAVLILLHHMTGGRSRKLSLTTRSSSGSSGNRDMAGTRPLRLLLNSSNKSRSTSGWAHNRNSVHVNALEVVASGYEKERRLPYQLVVSQRFAALTISRNKSG